MLGKDLILERSSDTQDFIRKGVYESISELGASELKLACSIQSLMLIAHIFKGVMDEDASTAAMQAILKVSARMKVTADQD